MPRLYGRCVGGARIYDHARKKRKGKVSLLAAMTNTGMSGKACLVHEGSVDSNAFLTFIEQVLCPSLEPKWIVIMDNFTIHKNSGVKALIEQAGCTLLFLPIYSPDFNPIEHLFAKIKAFIRKVRPQTVPDLILTFARAVTTVQPLDAANAFSHCGYR